MTSFAATERRTVQSVAVNNDAMADVITLVEILNGDQVVCRNTVRETMPASDVVEDLNKLLKTAA